MLQYKKMYTMLVIKHRAKVMCRIELLVEWLVDVHEVKYVEL